MEDRVDWFSEKIKRIGVKHCEDIHRMQLSATMLSGVVAPLQQTGVPTEHFGSVVWGRRGKVSSLGFIIEYLIIMLIIQHCYFHWHRGIITIMKRFFFSLKLSLCLVLFGSSFDKVKCKFFTTSRNFINLKGYHLQTGIISQDVISASNSLIWIRFYSL